MAVASIAQRGLADPLTRNEPSPRSQHAVIRAAQGSRPSGITAEGTGMFELGVFRKGP